jgi:hypothetical protein
MFFTCSSGFRYSCSSGFLNPEVKYFRIFKSERAINARAINARAINTKELLIRKSDKSSLCQGKSESAPFIGFASYVDDLFVCFNDMFDDG